MVKKEVASTPTKKTSRKAVEKERKVGVNCSLHLYDRVTGGSETGDCREGMMFASFASYVFLSRENLVAEKIATKARVPTRKRGVSRARRSVAINKWLMM